MLMATGLRSLRPFLGASIALLLLCSSVNGVADDFSYGTVVGAELPLVQSAREKATNGHVTLNPTVAPLRLTPWIGLRFDASAVPDNAIIEDATLQLFHSDLTPSNLQIMLDFKPYSPYRADSSDISDRPTHYYAQNETVNPNDVPLHFTVTGLVDSGLSQPIGTALGNRRISFLIKWEEVENAQLLVQQSRLFVTFAFCNTSSFISRTDFKCGFPHALYSMPFELARGPVDVGPFQLNTDASQSQIQVDNTSPSDDGSLRVGQFAVEAMSDVTSPSQGTLMFWTKLVDPQPSYPYSIAAQILDPDSSVYFNRLQGNRLEIGFVSAGQAAIFTSEVALLPIEKWMQFVISFGPSGMRVYLNGSLLIDNPDVAGGLPPGATPFFGPGGEDDVVDFDDITLVGEQLTPVEINLWRYCVHRPESCPADQVCRGIATGFDCFDPCFPDPCLPAETCIANASMPLLHSCLCETGLSSPEGECVDHLTSSSTSTSTTSSTSTSSSSSSSTDSISNESHGPSDSTDDDDNNNNSVNDGDSSSGSDSSNGGDINGGSIPPALCTSFYCKNGGTCSVQSGVPMCTCAPGYLGSRCQAQSACASNMAAAIAWPLTEVGAVVSRQCPSGMHGSMTRRCGYFGWLDVDTSQCTMPDLDASLATAVTELEDEQRPLNMTALGSAVKEMEDMVDSASQSDVAVGKDSTRSIVRFIYTAAKRLKSDSNSSAWTSIPGNKLAYLRAQIGSMIKIAAKMASQRDIAQSDAKTAVRVIDDLAGVVLREVRSQALRNDTSIERMDVTDEDVLGTVVPWLAELLQFETRGSGPRANITVGQAHVDLPQTLFGALTNNDTALGISVSLMPRAHALGLNLTESLAAALSGRHHQLLVGSKLVSASAHFLAQNDPSDVSTDINGSFPVADLVDLRVPVLDALSAAQDMAAMITDDTGSGEQADMHVDDAQWNLVEQADGSGLVYQLSFTIVRAILSDNDTSLEVTEQTHVVIVRPTCAWLDLSKDAWNNEGCSVADVSKDAVVCRCNHLTNFAVLMNADTAVTQGSHAEVLSTFGLVTMGVSLVFYTLIAISVTLLWMRRHAKLHHKMLLQLAIAGLCLQAVFVAVSSGPYDYDVCVAVSSLLHYSFLALSMNMLAQAYLLYKYFVIVMPGGLSDGAVLVRATAATWLVPLVVVVPAVLVDPSGYVTWSSAEESDPAVEPEPELCWVSPGSNIYLIAIVPLAVVVGMCAIVYVRAMTTVTRAKAATRGLKARLRASVAFFFVLGLSWAFGLLITASNDVGLQYVFAILSLLQGPVLWYFNCWSNKDVRLMYRQLVGLERSTTSKSVFVGRKGTTKTSTRSGGTWLLSPKWSKKSMQNRPPSAQSRCSSTPCSLMLPTESRKTSVEKQLGKATPNIATRLQTLHEEQGSSVSDEHSTTHAYDSQATVTSADVSVRIFSGAAPSTDTSSFIATGIDHAHLSAAAAQGGRQSFDSSVVYSSDEDDESDGSENDAALGYVHVDK